MERTKRNLLKSLTYSHMNNVMNAFLSHYYSNLESIYYSNHCQYSREEIAEIMDEVLMEKRKKWEDECLENCQKDIEKKMKGIDSTITNLLNK